MSDEIVITLPEVPGKMREIRQRKGLSLKRLGSIVYESDVVLSYRENSKRPITLESVERWAKGLGYNVRLVMTACEADKK